MPLRSYPLECPAQATYSPSCDSTVTYAAGETYPSCRAVTDSAKRPERVRVMDVPLTTCSVPAAVRTKSPENGF